MSQSSTRGSSRQVEVTVAREKQADIRSATLTAVAAWVVLPVTIGVWRSLHREVKGAKSGRRRAPPATTMAG